MARKKYFKNSTAFVIAIQFNFKTGGFAYEMWGGSQVCKPGDWIVKNLEETYSIDREVFEKTYKEIDQGLYIKITPVWAEIADEPGVIHTKEGITEYTTGDYIVSNDEEGKDAYAIIPSVFEKLYEPIGEDND